MNNFINSIWSKLLGVILVFGGACFFFIGEQVTLWEYTPLAIFQHEVVDAVQTVKTTELDVAAYQGKLVYITGAVTSNQTLRDDFFGINAKNTLSLRRDVYKYKEYEVTERVWLTVTRPSYTGRYKYKEVEIYENRTQTVVDWTYDKVVFHRASLALENQLFMVDKARLGPFNLPTSMIKLTIVKSDGDFANEFIALQKIPPQLKDYPIQLRSGVIYIGQNPEKEPQVDDVKISLSKLKPVFVSVLAKVQGNTFVPYITPSGQKIHGIETPPDSLDDMLSSYKPWARRSDSEIWSTRLIGAGAFFVGLMLCFSWLARLIQAIPILNRLVTVGYFFTAFSLTLAFVALGVAGTWWVVSPWQSLVGGLMGLIPLGVVLLLGDK